MCYANPVTLPRTARITKLLSSLLLACMALLQPLAILACGLSMIPSPIRGWDYASDSSEQSFINYQDGIEKLIISRNFANGSNQTIWILPLPVANPQDITLNVLDILPNFNGENILPQASKHLDYIAFSLYQTQIYPIIPEILMVAKYFLDTTNVVGDSKLEIPQPNIGFAFSPQDVIVHQHLEKSGMVSEVLSATSSSALYNYLNNLGLQVNQESISELQDYIGKDFAFVASWVSPQVNPTQATKGLLMTFPTNKIFYPLKAESGTPGEGLPENITVTDHINPNLYPNIKNDTQVNYFYSSSGTTVPQFFTTNKGFNYTQITIKTRPSNLTQDLYMSNFPPLYIINAGVLNHHPVVYGLLMLSCLTFLSTFIASLFTLKPFSLKTFYKLALASHFTLIGSYLGARIFLKSKVFRFTLIFTIAFMILNSFSLYIIHSTLTQDPVTLSSGIPTPFDQ